MTIGTEKYKIVPDRWSKTGWKYVKEEQVEKNKFFNHPNRSNSFGIEPESKVNKMKQLMQMSYDAEDHTLVSRPKTRG